MQKNPYNYLTLSGFSTARRIEEIRDDVFNTLTEARKHLKCIR
jgi:hypothetical protein